MSRPYAEVIGDPIAHSKSPAIHNFWLGKLGIEAEYRVHHVRPAELTEYFARRRGDAEWRGCNVTVPHKVAALKHVDRVDPSAAAIGATNTVVAGEDGLAALNTDADGFAESLPAVQGNTAIVIGAGGASRAVLVALRERGVERFTLINRDVSKAVMLLQEFGLAGTAGSLEANVEPAQILVNASTLGMTGWADSPDLTHRVTPDGVVYDLVYTPLETALLRAAKGRGLRTIDGLAMLIGQAAVAFEKFFGRPAPREHDAELRGLLTS